MIVVHQHDGRRVDSAQPGQPAGCWLAAVGFVVDGGDIVWGCGDAFETVRFRFGAPHLAGDPDEMQAVLDDYFAGYDHRRAHKGRNINGGTPARAFAAGWSKPTMESEKSKPKKSHQNNRL